MTFLQAVDLAANFTRSLSTSARRSILPTLPTCEPVLRSLRCLFKIRALRQESPVAVKFQFGLRRARNGDPISIKIAVNITWYQLISVNSPLYAREAAPLRSLCWLLFNSGPTCVSCAPTRISRALSRELRSSPASRDAFTGADVRQCVPPWRDAALFSREAFDSKNSSFLSKSSLDAFLSSFLCDLIRVISTDFDLIRPISTKITSPRAKVFIRAIRVIRGCILVPVPWPGRPSNFCSNSFSPLKLQKHES